MVARRSRRSRIEYSNSLSKAQRRIAWLGALMISPHTACLGDVDPQKIVTIILLRAPPGFVAVPLMRTLRDGPAHRLAAGSDHRFSTLHIGRHGARKIAMCLVGGSYDFRFSVSTVIIRIPKDLITCY